MTVDQLLLQSLPAMEPTEDEVSQVLDFLSLDPVEDRSLVIRALQVSRATLQRSPEMNSYTERF